MSAFPSAYSPGVSAFSFALFPLLSGFPSALLPLVLASPSALFALVFAFPFVLIPASGLLPIGHLSGLFAKLMLWSRRHSAFGYPPDLYFPSQSLLSLSQTLVHEPSLHASAVQAKPERDTKLGLECRNLTSAQAAQDPNSAVFCVLHKRFIQQVGHKRVACPVTCAVGSSSEGPILHHDICRKSPWCLLLVNA